MPSQTMPPEFTENKPPAKPRIPPQLNAIGLTEPNHAGALSQRRPGVVPPSLHYQGPRGSALQCVPDAEVRSPSLALNPFAPSLCSGGAVSASVVEGEARCRPPACPRWLELYEHGPRLQVMALTIRSAKSLPILSAIRTTAYSQALLSGGATRLG